MFSFIFILFLINRNHSITYVVKNVKQTINNGDNIDLYSETFRAFGLDWCLSIKTTNKYNIEFFTILLLVKGDFSKE